MNAHDYDEFVARAKVGELEPSVDDYADLDAARNPVPTAVDEGEVIAAIAEDGQTLVAAALAAPNTEISGTLADALGVDVLAEVIFSLEDGADVFIAFKLPPRPGVTLPDPLLEVTVGVMLPEADPADIDWRVENFPGRTPEAGEWVVRWRRPAS